MTNLYLYILIHIYASVLLFSVWLLIFAIVFLFFSLKRSCASHPPLTIQLRVHQSLHTPPLRRFPSVHQMHLSIREDRSLPESASSSSSTSPNITSSDSSQPSALCPMAPSPFGRSNKRRANDVLVKRLETINRERSGLPSVKQLNEDEHFGGLVTGLLSRIHVDRKSTVKFKIHQLLFEAEQNYPAGKYQDFVHFFHQSFSNGLCNTIFCFVLEYTNEKTHF